ncbi:MAG TPA: RNA ligase family protein [Gemmataceae bacterium]|nr:RNA ligase family protein [Gemmataceae bacterium]
MAKISLVYPKIPGSQQAPSGRCIAFEKYDGTNLHWVWDREFGWITFGTRRDSFYLDGRGVPEFCAAHPGLEEAAELFLRTHATPLEGVFRSHDAYRSAQLTVFTEFVGARSFAGIHQPDDPKQLVLFDVQPDAGLIGPEQFVRDFGELGSARVVYRGKLTGKFSQDVREGKYDVAEGVVCKGGSGGDLWMVKIKTAAYMEKLKRVFKDRWGDYWE